MGGFFFLALREDILLTSRGSEKYYEEFINYTTTFIELDVLTHRMQWNEHKGNVQWGTNKHSVED